MICHLQLLCIYGGCEAVEPWALLGTVGRGQRPLGLGGLAPPGVAPQDSVARTWGEGRRGSCLHKWDRQHMSQQRCTQKHDADWPNEGGVPLLFQSSSKTAELS